MGGNDLEEDAGGAHCGDSEQGSKEEAEEDFLKLLATNKFPTRAAENASAKKLCKAAKEIKPWQNNQRPDMQYPSKKRKQWSTITSSSKASSMSSLFYLRAANWSPSLRTSTRCLASFFRAVGVVLQNTVTVIHDVIGSLASALWRWVSMVLSAVRHSLDFVWAGPVEGVTTTGIPPQKGIVRSLLVPSSPAALAVSALAMSGLATWLLRKLWHAGAAMHEDGQSLPWDRWRKKIAGRHDGNDEKEDAEGRDAPMPPSVEEELAFLHREFIPANPATRDRVVEAIVSKRHRAPPSAKKSRRRQRQFTIKSIQTWWKGRPGQTGG